ncbi:2-oxoacid:acceptor oxidoreductase subunit alpha [soil metagenome]
MPRLYTINNMKYNGKIGGEAGFGIMTSGQILSKIAARAGYHVYDYTEYPSLIRGGHNTYEVVISDEPVGASKWAVDMLVCLNKETFDHHKKRLHKESYVIYDPGEVTPEGEGRFVPIPFKKIKQEQQVHQQLINTVALAASLVLMGGKLETFEDILRIQFSKKGQEIVDFNIKLARIGHDQVKNSGIEVGTVLVEREDRPDKATMAGNDMFSLAAVGADCRYFAAYPMTPASTVLSDLAAWQYETGMVVRHPEDEIAVINSALGASFAGARSAVATSGGGFALMVEALSYAGIAEIPVVVFMSMRPGPATGMPTWTEQADLLFTVHAGHGEYPKIVFTPGDIDEMLSLTLKGFDMADIYQTPVIVMSDKQLSESRKDILASTLNDTLKNHSPNRGKIVEHTNQMPYLRFKDETDGISEMLLPGQPDIFYQANSYEHVEDSHTSEDAAVKIQQTNKRNRKIKTYLTDHFELPKIYGDPSQSDIIFVSWGSVKGAIREAQKDLETLGTSTAYIHFTHVYPMDEKKIQGIFDRLKNKRIILIENNSQAQFGQLLRMQTGITIDEKFLKYDGRPFWPEEIVNYITKGTMHITKIDIASRLSFRH